jgi:hypothetical protein
MLKDSRAECVALRDELKMVSDRLAAMTMPTVIRVTVEDTLALKEWVNGNSTPMAFGDGVQVEYTGDTTVGEVPCPVTEALRPVAATLDTPVVAGWTNEELREWLSANKCKPFYNSSTLKQWSWSDRAPIDLEWLADGWRGDAIGDRKQCVSATEAARILGAEKPATAVSTWPDPTPLLAIVGPKGLLHWLETHGKHSSHEGIHWWRIEGPNATATIFRRNDKWKADGSAEWTDARTAAISLAAELTKLRSVENSAAK